MRLRGLRILGISLLMIIGLIMGACAAVAFNVAGLGISAGGFARAPFWEPVEGEITVVFGVVLLVGWLLSVIGLIFYASTAKAMVWKAVIFAAVMLNIAFVVAAMIVSVVILPGQYGWITP